MSSNFVYQIRRYSGDPGSQRFQILSERLAQFEAATLQAQTGDIKNYINITRSIIQYKEQDIVSLKAKTTTFYLPLEPDGKLLTCWFKFEAWGKVVRDVSLTGNSGIILGQAPTAVVGPDRGLGSSIAMSFDGLTQFIEANDNTSIQFHSGSVGFSVAVLIYPTTFTTTATGEVRYIAEKLDDTSDFWGLFIDTSGNVHFNIKAAGIDYSIVTTSTISLNTWTWIMLTFNWSSHTPLIYFNGTVQSTTTETVRDSDYSGVRPNLYVGATAVNDGFFQGNFADFRYYKELVLSSTQVSNLNTNMLSVSSIAFGAVSISSYAILGT